MERILPAHLYAAIRGFYDRCHFHEGTQSTNRRDEQVAANGVDIDKLRDETLPPASAQEVGAVYDHDLGEYILTQ